MAAISGNQIDGAIVHSAPIADHVQVLIKFATFMVPRQTFVLIN